MHNMTAVVHDMRVRGTTRGDVSSPIPTCALFPPVSLVLHERAIQVPTTPSRIMRVRCRSTQQKHEGLPFDIKAGLPLTQSRRTQTQDSATAVFKTFEA